MCTAVPLHAADWKLAGLATGADNRGVTYVDVSSVREVRGKVRFRTEQHLEKPENGIDRLLSVVEVDCSRMTVTVLRAQYFRGAGLVGMVGTPREDNAYSSTTSTHWVIRRICDEEYLSGPIADTATQAKRMFAMDWAPFAEQLAVTLPQSHSWTQVASMTGRQNGNAPAR